VRPNVIDKITAEFAVEPTAQHADVLGQTMPERDKIPLGRVCDLQVLPPLAVATATAAVGPEPIAQHADVLGQAMP
jgi:hypothetical protein